MLSLVQFPYCIRQALFYRSCNLTHQLHKMPKVDYRGFWNTSVSTPVNRVLHMVRHKIDYDYVSFLLLHQ
jgi:hypothetical protein